MYTNVTDHDVRDSLDVKFKYTNNWLIPIDNHFYNAV